MRVGLPARIQPLPDTLRPPAGNQCSRRRRQGERERNRKRDQERNQKQGKGELSGRTHYPDGESQERTPASDPADPRPAVHRPYHLRREGPGHPLPADRAPAATRGSAERASGAQEMSSAAQTGTPTVPTSRGDMRGRSPPRPPAPPHRIRAPKQKGNANGDAIGTEVQRSLRSR